MWGHVTVEKEGISWDPAIEDRPVRFNVLVEELQKTHPHGHSIIVPIRFPPGLLEAMRAAAWPLGSRTVPRR